MGKKDIRMLLGVLTVLLTLLWAGMAFSTILGSKHDLGSLTGGNTFQSTNETEVCIFCHTPHQAVVTDSAGNRLPLWNRSIARNDAGGAGGPFSVYSSSTLNATVGQPSGLTLLCMSCHDGVTAINSLINYSRVNPILMKSGYDQIGDIYFPQGGVAYPGANIGGAIPASSVPYPQTYAPYGGVNNVTQDTKRIDDDHPVSFTFNAALATADGALQLPAANDPIKLFAGKMECATCHDPHEEGTLAGGDYPFLRKSNVESAICTTCHLK